MDNYSHEVLSKLTLGLLFKKHKLIMNNHDDCLKKTSIDGYYGCYRVIIFLHKHQSLKRIRVPRRAQLVNATESYVVLSKLMLGLLF